MRRTLIVVGLMLLGAVATAPLACRTGPDGQVEVDWTALGRELALTAADLEQAAGIVEDPDLAADLTRLAELSAHAAEAVQGAGEGADPIVAIRAALKVAEQLAAETDDQDVQLAVFAVSALLRRLEAYAPAEPLPGPE